MARVLSQLEVDDMVAQNAQETQSRYPWDDWTTGEWWMAVKGVDFFCEPNSFRMAVIMHGRRRSIKSTTYVVGQAVLFRFTDE